MAKTGTKPFHPKYAVHPGVLRVQKWISELEAKSGRSLDEWLRLCRKEGPGSEIARRDWLKKNHGLGTNTAWWIAERSMGKASEDDDPKTYLQAAKRYVEAMYEGKKAALRPIHDALIKLAIKAGTDVRLCPCKTMVPVYRNHVFAEIKPSTNSRIDLGFALGALKAKGRLIDTGGFGRKDRITHRIPITAVDDIDEEVRRWLRTAYNLDK